MRGIHRAAAVAALFLSSMLLFAHSAQLDYRLMYGLGSYCRVTLSSATPRTCSDVTGCVNPTIDEPISLAGITWRICGSTTSYVGELTQSRPIYMPRFQNWDWECLITTSGRWPVLRPPPGAPVAGRTRLAPDGMLGVFIAPTFAMPAFDPTQHETDWRFYMAADQNTMIRWINSYYHTSDIISQWSGQSPRLPQAVTLPIPWNVDDIRFATTAEIARHSYSGGFNPGDGNVDTPLSLLAPSSACSKLFFGYKKIPAGFPVQMYETDQRSDLGLEYANPFYTQDSLLGQNGGYTIGIRPFAYPPSNPYDYRVFLNPASPIDTVYLGITGNEQGAYCFDQAGCEYGCPSIIFRLYLFGAEEPINPVINIHVFYAIHAWATRAYKSYPDCLQPGRTYDYELINQGVFEIQDFSDLCIYEDPGADSPFIGTITWLPDSGCADPYISLVVPGAMNIDTPAPAYVEWLDPYQGGAQHAARIITVLGLNQAAVAPRPITSTPLYDINRLQFIETWCRITAPTPGTADPGLYAAYLNSTNGILQPKPAADLRNLMIHVYAVDNIPIETPVIYVELTSTGAGGNMVLPSKVQMKNDELFFVPSVTTLTTQSIEYGDIFMKRLNPTNTPEYQYSIADHGVSVPRCSCVNSTAEIRAPGDVVCTAELKTVVINIQRRSSSFRGALAALRNCSISISQDTPFSSIRSDGRYVLNQYQMYLMNSTYYDAANPRSLISNAVTYLWYVTNSTSPPAVDSGSSVSGPLYNFTSYVPVNMTLVLDIRSAVSFSLTRCTLDVEIVASCPPITINAAKTVLAPGETVMLESSSIYFADSRINVFQIGWGLLWAFPRNVTETVVFTGTSSKVATFTAPFPGLYSVVVAFSQFSSAPPLGAACTGTAQIQIRVVNGSDSTRRVALPGQLNMTTSCLGDGGTFDELLPNSTRYQNNGTAAPIAYVPLGKSYYDQQDPFTFQAVISEIARTQDKSRGVDSIYYTVSAAWESLWYNDIDVRDNDDFVSTGSPSQPKKSSLGFLYNEPTSAMVKYIVLGVVAGVIVLTFIVSFVLVPFWSCCNRCTRGNKDKEDAEMRGKAKDGGSGSENEDSDDGDEEKSQRMRSSNYSARDLHPRRGKQGTKKR